MDPKMVVTVALVVLFSSILVFFANEFGKFFKKIFAIPGLKLILPLILASWVITLYQDWILWLFLWFQALLMRALKELALMLPIAYSIIIVRIIFLLVISCSPLWLFAAKVKYKKLRTPVPKSTYWFSIVLWIVGALFLIF